MPLTSHGLAGDEQSDCEASTILRQIGRWNGDDADEMKALVEQYRTTEAFLAGTAPPLHTIDFPSYPLPCDLEIAACMDRRGRCYMGYADVVLCIYGALFIPVCPEDQLDGRDRMIVQKYLRLISSLGTAASIEFFERNNGTALALLFLALGGERLAAVEILSALPKPAVANLLLHQNREARIHLAGLIAEARKAFLQSKPIPRPPSALITRRIPPLPE